MKIKYLLMDVDGTLTNGKIYISNEGEAFKQFCAKDGCGIRELLPPAGITPVIITGRVSTIVQNRCAELDITMCFQGVKNKIRKLDEILAGTGYTYENMAYIGDDLNDLSCMRAIKGAGGLVGCPADAAKEVRETADFVSSRNGGDGAVREFVEWLLAGD